MITPLHPDQLDAVMNIWLETNISAHHFIPASYWQDNADEVRGLLPQADVFVYQADDQIKGFVGVVDGGYIAGIFVADAYQSQGIGQALLDYCKSHYTSLTLDVYAKNEKAIRFYLKQGFHVQQETLNEATGELELQMIWKIS
jgi:putative acetyltransferase